MDVLTPQQRHRCMQANKSFGTKPELALGRLLWSCGLRYRKHPKNVTGRPDFCIRKYRLAIFVDGEFWHGRDWEDKKKNLKGNRDFWIAKIERNIERDRRVNTTLSADGWKVFRFWETDIRKHPGRCIGAVLRYLAGFTSESAPQYIPADYTLDTPSAPIAADPGVEYGDG